MPSKPHDPSPPPPFRLGQCQCPGPRRWRPARRSSSRPSTPRAASSRQPRRSRISQALDFAKVNPVTGPVYIDGAEPGDALKVTLLSFRAVGLGLDRQHPGLRAARRPVPGAGAAHLAIRSVEPGACRLRAGRARAAEAVRRHHRAGAGRAGPALASSRPGACGGNMDIRDLAAGTELYLPVEVAGALFSVGDTHAAQGDGEVCGTAIESPMSVVAALRPRQGRQPAVAALHHPGPVTRHLDGEGYEVTTGIGPDLMQAARDAVSGMIDLLASALRHGAGRRLHAVQRLRRPADQRDRRSCRTGSCRSTSRASSCSDRRGWRGHRDSRRLGARAGRARGRLPRTTSGTQRRRRRRSAFGWAQGGSWAWSASPAAARA